MAKLCRIDIGQRMTPPDWISDLFALGESSGKRFFFLGDEEQIVEEFTRQVQSNQQNLNIVGCHLGFLFGKGVNENLLKVLRDSKADIILTAMGMPVQEIWANSVRHSIPPSKIIATGAMFRHYIGGYQRPRIADRVGVVCTTGFRTKESLAEVFDWVA